MDNKRQFYGTIATFTYGMNVFQIRFVDSLERTDHMDIEIWKELNFVTFKLVLISQLSSHSLEETKENVFCVDLFS